MLPGGPQRRAAAVSTVIGLAEACKGAGMLAGQAPVRRAGPAVSAAVAGGAVPRVAAGAGAPVRMPQGGVTRAGSLADASAALPA